jgi:hypothetical protein
MSVIYEEKYPKTIISIIALIIIFLILYSPWHWGLKELFGSEGKYAALALDMNLLTPSTIAQGKTLSFYFPMYPWIVAIAYKLGFSIEIGLRGVSVLALSIIGIVVFETGRRISGIQAGIIAAAVMVANIYVLDKANDGNPFTLGVLFLLLAWLTWYLFGALRGDWDTSWIVSMLFCGLAFYTIGWIALVYFFVPLIFMRRPLTVWNKLPLNGFYIGICILAAFVLLWFIPRMTDIINNPFDSFNVFQKLAANNFQNFLLYPLAICGGLMPWTIIAWPSFCVAYFPLDKNPIFSRFLRTLFLSLFVVLWINPFTEARDAIILIPPIAILTGTNYWLVVRRNGYALHKLLHLITIVLFIIISVSFILFWVPLSWWHSFPLLKWVHTSFLSNGISFFSDMFLWGVIQCGLGILISLYLLVMYKRKLAIWSHALGICLVFMLGFWSITYPYKTLSDDGKKTASVFIHSLGKNYSKNLILYTSSQISDIYVLGCYLGCNIKNLQSLTELPTNKKTVYLISLSAPIYPERQWEKVSEVDYKSKYLSLWKGDILTKGANLKA